MKITVTSITNASINPITARCPHCGNEAVFSQLGQDLAVANQVVTGQRACPNPNCHGHIFIVAKDGHLANSYPPLRIDFNAASIPDGVRETFEEALDCQAAGCAIASAIMVRRTLEEICAERKATGKNLKDRLKDLESKIVVPKELIDAMDELRLLGNDATHIESKSYKQVSGQELEIAIEFTKEILKALYQYSSLLDRLRSLKKSGTP